jgi:phage baseplate assembly protein W
MKDFLMGQICDHLIGNAKYIQSTCPKCGGTGTTQGLGNDLIEKNRYIEISGEMKLRQQILKILMTPKGYYDDELDYGCELLNIIGGKHTLLTFSKIRKAVIDSLQYLIENQVEDLPDNEKIYGIENFKIVTDSSVPGSNNVTFDVITVAGTRFNMMGVK